MMPAIRSIFDSMAAQHDRAVYLGVARWIRPFLGDLSKLTDDWMATFVKASPPQIASRAQELHDEIKQGFEARERNDEADSCSKRMQCTRPIDRAH